MVGSQECSTYIVSWQGRAERVGNGMGGWIRVNRESGFDRNVRGKEQDGSPGNLGFSEDRE
jgi:hypothetical protein